METQQSIREWLNGITGTDYTLDRALARAFEEIAELNSAVCKSPANIDPDNLCEEAADVAICLCRPADLLNHSIDRLIRIAPRQLESGSVSAIDRANCAMVRLIHLCRDQQSEAKLDFARTQLGLVIIHLADFCASFGKELGAEVDRKMARNRARKWRTDGSGQAYHTAEPEPAVNCVRELGGCGR